MRVIAALLLCAGCDVFPSEFACSEDTQCARGAQQGRCVMGRCAFRDEGCPSGFRFDTSAGEGASTCTVASVDAGPIPESADAGPPPTEDDAGPRVDSGPDAGPLDGNGCGGDTVLPGLPGTPCGTCDMGRYACDGEEAVVCVDEPSFPDVVTHQADVQASSVFSFLHRAELAVDTDLSTSWFSSGPEGVPTRFALEFRSRQCFSTIQWFNNYGHDNVDFREGFGFGQAVFRVLDGEEVVYSEIVELPGTPDPNQRLDLDPPVGGDTIEMLFTGHEDSSCGGFGEVIVNALR